MNLFSLTDDRWIDYCRSLSPAIPHNGPMPLIVPLLICCMFGVFLFLLLGHFANALKRPVTPDDFEEAYDRILAPIPLLGTRKGEDLSRLCRAISRDLLRVTGFVTSDVARCVRKYHSGFPPDFKSLAPIIALVRENATLRRNAIRIEILYRIKPLRPAMLRKTNESLSMFSGSWLSLLAHYCSENLQHGRF